MRLTVFGGTGAAGQLLVQRALEEGHRVTAFARNPAKLQPRANLDVVSGAIDDPVAVRQAVTGADAVISLLGPGRDRASIPALVPGTRIIVAAMGDAGVRRLVATSTPSAPDPSDGRDLRITFMVKAVRFSLPWAYNAVRSIDEAVRASPLDWTLVRLPMLHDIPTAGRARPRGVGEPGGLRLSRANLAAFLLEVVRDPAWIRRAPLVADN